MVQYRRAASHQQSALGHIDEDDGQISSFIQALQPIKHKACVASWRHEQVKESQVAWEIQSLWI